MVSGYRRAASEAPTSAADVADLYHLALELDEALFLHFRSADGDEPPSLEAFLDSDLKLPGLEPGCLAECSQPSLALNASFFAALAEATPGDEDDRFLALLTAYYGPETRLADRRPAEWPTYREQTWDYGGHSLLGSGTHHRLLAEIDTLLRTAQAFRTDLEYLREDLMRDLLETSDCAGLTGSEILSELGAILESESVDLSAEERSLLELRRAELENPAAHGIELDCRASTCRCNSG